MTRVFKYEHVRTIIARASVLLSVTNCPPPSKIKIKMLGSIVSLVKDAE